MAPEYDLFGGTGVATAPRRYWIGVAAARHVARGRAEGFAQLGHGKHTPIKRLNVGDLIAYYAPREGMGEGATVQAFTAIGVVTSEVYQVEQAPGFHPYRRDVTYFEARPAPIRPMLQGLGFIEDIQHWGMSFRRGSFAVSEADFGLIAHAMGVMLPLV
ncbi:MULTISPECIES: EVE domain-containing protein [Pacificibacter]|uniref:EVE domain-containing protein n=1 Tax=Pacificibacter TaxID=1042323 RepID=UPI001C088949|nr:MULTISPECIES: EVE domain-containing protein [Pacificibacter]MBU2935234.1 EVE domain-containing protein [Pacificibacter marinus]MDO6615388.1 EVE domain-containing protein [Pacificibacter sp. 1_MG-2023]